MLIALISILLFFGCQQNVERQKTTTSKTVKLDGVPNKKDKKSEPKNVRVLFYNLENLFDTKDDPNNPNDNEYLPNSHKKWTPKRYETKLKNLAKVIKSAGVPPIIGVAEIENQSVLEDLMDYVDNSNWEYVHRNSPDERGIDVALIYNKDIVELKAQEFIRIDFPREKDDATGKWRKDKTRDILYADLLVEGQPLNVFVNHWPSRRNPDKKRVDVAKHAKAKIDEIKSKNANANILLMGDFNDEPDNISLFKTLEAQNPANTKIQTDNLYNLSFAKHLQGKGTYNYRGEYNLLDNIIVSGGLLQPKSKLKTTVASFTIIEEDWMSFNHPRNGKMPNRTYGKEYYGGYSDHYPVYIDLVIE